MPPNNQLPFRLTATRFFIPSLFALVVFFFGFTDLPRMRDQAFPLFCLLLSLLLVPVIIDAKLRRREPRT